MDDTSSFSSSNLDFAKIVATPTNDSWSQVYHAGKLFSVLALKKEAKEEESEEQTLGTIGKDVLKTLEEEYFTLPQKNFDTIKQAVIFATEKIPKDLVSTFIIGSFIDNILYVFIKGKGIVLLKRGETFGTILHSANNEEVSGASGFLEDKDLVVLQTSEFSKIISQEDLKNSADNKKASEIAEILTPKIHEKEEGQASGVLIIFNKPQREEEFSLKENARESETQENELEEKETIETKTELEEKQSIDKTQEKSYIQEDKRRINFPNFAFSLSHKKKIFLSISLILFAVLISTVFLSFSNKENAKNQALVNEIYANANKKYEEGNALLGLNAILAREDLLEAKKILEKGKTKFKKDSEEDKKISELLQKVEAGLSSSSNATLTKTKKVDANESKLLNLMLSNNASYVSFYENDFYYSKDEGIFSEDKLIVKKDWEVMGGLGAYIGNLYVLDKNKNQIFKFTKTGSEYSKSNYLSNTSIDLSKANGIAIDGSIWVILTRSEILKLNRGNQESFSISGIEQPFSAQAKIFTNADTDNLYVLDIGNQRLVVLGKDGKYKSQYASGILKDAKDFEVREKDKKAFILSQNSIFELSLE